MSKFKIHNAEDVADHSDWVRNALGSISIGRIEERRKFADEHFEFRRFQSVGEAIRHYNEHSDYPDIAIIDLDYRELPTDYPDRETEATSTRGFDLLEFALEKFPDRIIRYFTGQLNEAEVAIRLTSNRILSELQVIKTDKASGSEMLEKLMPDFLRQVARKYVHQHITLRERQRIYKKIKELSKELLLKEPIDTNVGVFLFADFVVGWLGINNDEDFRAEMFNLFRPNLMLAASECFGIDGVKQATHHRSQKYFIDGWFNKMLSQLSNLSETTQRIIEMISEDQTYEGMESIIEGLADYRKKVDGFKERAVEIGDDHSNAMANLVAPRDRYFRYGTSQNGATAIEIGDLKIDSNTKKIGGRHLELYLPIHKLYEDQFIELARKSNIVTCHTYMTSEVRQQVTSRADKNPTLFKEYLIFVQIGSSEYEPNVPFENLPDSFADIRNKGFENFGTMYLILKQKGAWKLYDCTYSPVIEKQKPFETIESETFWSEIDNIEGAIAIFLFEFTGWRQI